MRPSYPAAATKIPSNPGALFMMKTLRTPLSILALGLVAFSSASAQHAVAPPPKPADSGPSLAVTMKFIQEKLNGIGTVSYVTFFRDTAVDTTFNDTRTFEFSNVIADEHECRIAYHMRYTHNRRPLTDSDFGFLVRDVQDMAVEPYTQHLNDVNAKGGAPNVVITSTDPPLTSLSVRLSHGGDEMFLFTDPELAGRVAKALTHAVELCDGGNKDPF
jgi:hypothetical protein